jgi:hypothetical protein
VSVARTSSYRFAPWGADGKLTPDAIESLVRRVWWGEYETRWEPDGARVKAAPLVYWWHAERWPAWWPAGSWVDCGNRLDARTHAGWLEVRRRHPRAGRGVTI